MTHLNQKEVFKYLVYTTLAHGFPVAPVLRCKCKKTAASGFAVWGAGGSDRCRA